MQLSKRLRTVAIIAFMIIYPMVIAIVENIPVIDEWYEDLVRYSSALNLIVSLGSRFLPPILVGYFFLRQKGAMVVVGALIAYLIIFIPVSLFVGFITVCAVNPQCVLP